MVKEEGSAGLRVVQKLSGGSWGLLLLALGQGKEARSRGESWLGASDTGGEHGSGW